MRLHGLKRLRSDEGDSMIEFGLVAIMFVIVLLGIVDMGRMVLVYTTLAQSARAGTRYAIVHGKDRTGTIGSTADAPSGPSNYTQVQTVVKNYASAGLLNLSNLNVAVSYPNGTYSPGSPVTVTVTYTYDPLVSYYSRLLNVSMSSSSQGVIVF